MWIDALLEKHNAVVNYINSRSSLFSQSKTFKIKDNQTEKLTGENFRTLCDHYIWHIEISDREAFIKDLDAYVGEMK